jgi:hypothetical protein
MPYYVKKLGLKTLHPEFLLHHTIYVNVSQHIRHFFQTWTFFPPYRMNNSVAKGTEGRRGKGLHDGSCSHNHPRMSPCMSSRVLLKQSRLFDLVLLPWDLGLWYVDNSFNKELVTFRGVPENLGPSLSISLPLFVLNSLSLSIRNET